MTRQERVEEIVKAIKPVGRPVDTNAVEVVHADTGRFLLVEKNRGAAAAEQSHWFTSHSSLDAAWSYHDRNEYPEDWEVACAVDLDTGKTYVPGRTTVKWQETEQPIS
jgi:hypothetical protein